MSDITLINITSKNTYDGKIVNRLSTIGIYSLIACLEDSGISVDFREYFLDFEKSSSEEMVTAVKFFKNSEKIIGIGCHSIHLPFVARVAQEIKKAFPDKFIILGGVGPSIVARPLMELIKDIDLIVIGEAEVNLPQLVKALIYGGKKLSDIKGIIFREDNKIIAAPPIERVNDLDDLPMPAYKYLDVGLYKQPMVMSARGCPFGCPFCSLGAYWNRKVSYRSPERIQKELQTLSGMGVKRVFFADPCFMLNKERLIGFADVVKKDALMEELKTYGRLDLVDRETCQILADANFKAIFYGLESGSDSVLRQIKRGIRVQDGLETIRMTKKYFTRIEVSLMWGFPFETLGDLKKTIDIHNYLKDELGCVVQLTWFQPFANTRYFQEYKNILMKPESLSGIYDRRIGREQIHSTLDRAKEYDYTISLRSMIGHSHVYSLAKELIDSNPCIFPDFYRYKTPDLDKKLDIVNKIVPN